MPICSTCGAPDHMRCNCVTTPYCDQCDENDACNSEMDSACVFYHPTYPGQTPLPSNLIALALPNGSTAQTIFDAIDAYLRNNVGKPVIPIDSPSVDLTATGFSLRADVIISPDTNNQLSIHSNGLYAAPYINLFKVKTDVTGAPKYLEDALVGGTDGCVSITSVLSGGVLSMQPLLDIECLVGRICSADVAVKEQLTNCLLTAGFGVLDTNSVDLTLATVGSQLILSADSKISATAGNTITINADGLYSAGGGTVNAANNGLNLSGTIVKLGGPLLANTTITGAFQMYFNNRNLISGNVLDPYFSTRLAGISTISSNTNNSTALSNSSLFTTNTINVTSSNQNAAGETTTAATDVMAWVIGTNLTPNNGSYISAAEHHLSLDGAESTVFTTSADNIFPAAEHIYVQFRGGHTIAPIYDKTAGINIHGPFNYAPDGVAYTKATNYYGIYIQDLTRLINTPADYPNLFAIYQQGVTDISRFFGPVQNAGGTTQFTSDSRVKENISTFSRGLAEVEKIDTHTFNYTYNKDKKITGIIAQELELIIPEAVEQGTFETPDGDKFTDFRMVDQNVIFYTMLNAIKDLSAQNKALASRLSSLESKAATA